jgi:hypothetical protein
MRTMTTVDGIFIARSKMVTALQARVTYHEHSIASRAMQSII